MAIKFNPLTGNFDFTGSGGGGGGASYIDGEVQNFSALPTANPPAVDSAYLVREPEGTWLINRKPAGIYIRVATTGTRATDWTYAGILPDVFNDANFLLYDNGDSSKNLAFQLSGITTGTTRTLTVPDASGTIARTETFAAPPAIGNTTPAAGSFTTLSSNTGTITASTPLAVTQTWNNSATFFRVIETNITNTQSQTESYHLACNVGGSLVAYIRRDGRIVGTGNVYGSAGLESALLPQGVAVGNASYIGFCTNSFANDTGGDLRLFRDAANVLAQRNAANSQESRLYSTFTSSTNYQRMTVKSVKQTLSALSGASATTTGTFIPDGAVVVGVTTRVSTLLTGATGYTIGDGTDADRWGDITGTAVGTTSDNRDWTAGTIECFTAGGNITLTAKTANFTAGAIEISVFYLAGEAD
jgi:hypothetical protein